MTDHAERFQEDVARLVRRIRVLADDVERIGADGDRHPPTRAVTAIDRAYNIHRKITDAISNFDTGGLLIYAMRADHPATDLTPGQLLDKAATAVADELDQLQGCYPAPEPTAIAEAALRGAQVLR